MRIVEMRVEDFFGVCEWLVEAAADDRQVLRYLLVVDVVAFLPVVHLDLLVKRSIADCGISSGPGKLDRYKLKRGRSIAGDNNLRRELLCPMKNESVFFVKKAEHHEIVGNDPGRVCLGDKLWRMELDGRALR
jgi:hypothetical protein